jgi:hypothetical protein
VHETVSAPGWVVRSWQAGCVVILEKKQMMYEVVQKRGEWKKKGGRQTFHSIQDGAPVGMISMLAKVKMDDIRERGNVKYDGL